MPVVQALKDFPSRLRSLPKPLRIKISAVLSLLLASFIIVVLLRAFDSTPAPQSLPTSPTVGVEGFETLTLDQPSYQVAGITPNTPLLVGISAVEPIGDGTFRYRLSYKGLEKGVFNLTDFIVTPTGERLKEPVATVTIESAIPPHSTFAAVYNGPSFQGRAFPYRLTLLIGAIVWAGWGAHLFWPKPNPAPLPTPPEPAPREEKQPHVFDPRSLADLLRPLVQKAANKSITAAEKAEMEGILFQYWGQDLELDHLNSVEQLRRILEHPEAGALLRTVEQWLYQPDSLITEEEINEALESYLGIPSPPQQPAKTASTELSHSNVSTIPVS